MVQKNNKKSFTKDKYFILILTDNKKNDFKNAPEEVDL